MTYGDLSGLVDQKIMDSDLDKAFLLEQKEIIKAEWTASKKLASLFAPMNEQSRDLFETIVETVLPLDPEIRPSAIRTFLDYVQDNDSALKAQLKQPPITLAEEVLKRWLKEDLGRLQAVASNSVTTVAGSASLAYAASLEVGKVVTLDAPLLLAGSGSNIVIQIENAKGLGIDLDKLNAGQGVLFPLGISFQVVSRETVEGQIVYLLKALRN